MSNQQLLDLIIDKFDGSIVEDNKWRVTGSNGNHYWDSMNPFHAMRVVGVRVIHSEKLVETSKNLVKV